jgi:hypothetical protein
LRISPTAAFWSLRKGKRDQVAESSLVQNVLVGKKAIIAFQGQLHRLSLLAFHCPKGRIIRQMQVDTPL